MDRLVQIVPVSEVRLFGMMVKKEIELQRRGKGTFFRSGRKERNVAKWSHAAYKGWVRLHRTGGEVVVVEFKSASESKDEWQLLQAFIGWLDRHFSDQIQTINIQYRSTE